MSVAVERRPRSFSMSGLKNVACLKRYKAVMEDGVKETGVPALRGQAIHDSAHIYIEDLVAAQLTGDAELAKAAVQDVLGSMALPYEAAIDVRDVFMRWAERFWLDLDAFLCAEEGRREDGLSWRPDMVYARPSEVEIMDWKSHYAAMTEAEARKDFQVRFYCWRAKRAWPGFPRYRFTLDYMRLNQQVSVDFGPDELDEFEDDVAARVQLVQNARRTGEWPATMGPLCAWCSLACDLVDDARKRPVRVTDAAEAEAMATEMLALEAAFDSRRAAVQAWVEAHGPVTAAGKVLSWEPTSSSTFPVEGVVATLAHHVMPIPASLTVSASALGGLLTAKKHQAIAADLVKLEKSKPGRRWSVRANHTEE